MCVESGGVSVCGEWGRECVRMGWWSQVSGREE